MVNRIFIGSFGSLRIESDTKFWLFDSLLSLEIILHMFPRTYHQVMTAVMVNKVGAVMKAGMATTAADRTRTRMDAESFLMDIIAFSPTSSEHACK